MSKGHEQELALWENIFHIVHGAVPEILSFTITSIPLRDKESFRAEIKVMPSSSERLEEIIRRDRGIRCAIQSSIKEVGVPIVSLNWEWSYCRSQPAYRITLPDIQILEPLQERALEIQERATVGWQEAKRRNAEIRQQEEALKGVVPESARTFLERAQQHIERYKKDHIEPGNNRLFLRKYALTNNAVEKSEKKVDGRSVGRR